MRIENEYLDFQNLISVRMRQIPIKKSQSLVLSDIYVHKYSDKRSPHLVVITTQRMYL